MLEVGHLAVAYGQHRALKGVSLKVAPGEIVVILGANGAGKTSLLKAVAGMIPAQGQVRLGDATLTGLPPHRIVEAGLALVPEGRGIFGELSVRENLLLGAFAQRARQAEQANLDRVLGLFPRLAERGAQQARTMSGGEQQMVAIGRALMSAPAILMLDEPSLGLSPLLCTELFRTLKAVRDSGVGILLVEQNARQSLAIADRAYLLENGEIVNQGPAAQLAKDPAVQAAYLGGAAGHSAVLQTRPAAVVPASGEPAALAARALASVVPAAASSLSTPADALIPTRVAELVRIAARRQAEDVVLQREAPNLLDAATVASATASVQAAAARALAPAQSKSAHIKPAPAVAPSLEVWRRPGIEHWSRQRDGSMKKED